jgi:hypothetical protein
MSRTGVASAPVAGRRLVGMSTLLVGVAGCASQAATTSGELADARAKAVSVEDATMDAAPRVTEAEAPDASVDASDDASDSADADAASVPFDAGAGVVVLADNQQAPSFVVVDQTSVYWTTYDVGRTYVMKTSLEGGSPVTLAIGPGAPFGLAVDGANVYWTQSAVGGSGSVMSVPLDGGPSVPLAVGQTQPIGPAVDSTSIYWSERDGHVMRASLDGAAPSVLAVGQTAPSAVAVDPTSVYWTSQYSDPDSGVFSVPAVMRAPLDGGAPTLVGTTGGLSLVSFAVNGAAAYWSDANCSVQMALTDGGASSPLASADTWSCPLFMGGGGIAADGTSVYWAVQSNQDSPMGLIVKVLASGEPDASNPVATLAVGQSTPVGVAVDATHVYWTNSGVNTRSGQVMTAPK